MNCKYEGYIDGLINGNLSEKKEKALREHAKGCSECAGRLKEIDNIENIIRDQLEQFPYRSSKAKIMEKARREKSKVVIKSKLYSWRKYACAAAAIFILFISVQVFRPFMDNLKSNIKSTKTDNPKIADQKQSFEIYLVKRSDADTNGYQDGEVRDINHYELAEKPIITDKDIVRYHWNNHEIEFTKEFIEKQYTLNPDIKAPVAYGNGNIYNLYSGCKLLNTNSRDSFVIVVNGKRIYSGTFPEPLSSSFMPAVWIEDGPDNRIRIRCKTEFGDLGKIHAFQDPRPNKDIYDLFKKLGKLDN